MAGIVRPSVFHHSSFATNICNMQGPIFTGVRRMMQNPISKRPGCSFGPSARASLDRYSSLRACGRRRRISGRPRCLMTRLLSLGVALACAGPLLSQTPAPEKTIPWGQYSSEILTRYRDLVQLDTTAGHEIRAVDYLRKVLEGEGIPTKTLALEPNRPNLVARLKGNGSK